MKIALVTRKNEAKWGGDLLALYSFYEGLQKIGQDVIIGPSVEEVIDADLIFLSNTSLKLKEDYQTLQNKGKRFGVVCFHSDRQKYYSPCYGFATFVGLCLAQQEIPFFNLQQLWENPDIIHRFSYIPPPLFEENYPVLAEAECCIATSHTEAATLKRDCPECQAKIVYLECGIEDASVHGEDRSFLEWTGLKKGEYVLQVGRIELRKNQLSSILAMQEFDMPLVFIATESFYPAYELLCLEAIKKWRSAPTLVISQNLPSRQEGSLRILSMPKGHKLPQSMLISAYQNAGLYLHPAFCELPGLTCLEAAKLGIPLVVSEWMTLRDYFTDPSTQTYTLDDRIAYTCPYDIPAMREKILQQFGKKINKRFDHPMFRRTQIHVAQDFLKALPLYF